MKRCSFDVFDTLITRTVLRPEEIFEIIEQTYNLPNFKQLRIKAQILTNGTIDQIYQHLQQLTHWTNNQRDQIKQYELETELNYSIPIESMINQVNDQDLLISDTYLLADQVWMLLRKNGFTKQCPLYVSLRGKRDGTIYKHLQQLYHNQIKTHHGDDSHSDGTMAQKANITSNVLNLATFTKYERALYQNGFKILSTIFRSFRLKNPYPYGTMAFKTYNAQASVNLPFLVFIACDLIKRIKTENIKTLFLTTRDGCLLSKLIYVLAPEIDCRPLHASRIMYTHSNLDYDLYLRKTYCSESLIFDLFGSFQSGRTIFLRLFGQLPRVHLFVFNQQAPLYPKLTYSLISHINVIESFNLDVVGTLIDFINDQPIRAPIEYPREYVNIMHQTVDQFVMYANWHMIQREITKIPVTFWSNLYQNINFNDLIYFSKSHQSLDMIITNNQPSNLNQPNIKIYQSLIDHFANQYKQSINWLELGLQSNVSNVSIWIQYFNRHNLVIYNYNSGYSLNQPNDHIYQLNQLIEIKKHRYNIIVDHSKISMFNQLWGYVVTGGCYIIENVSQLQGWWSSSSSTSSTSVTSLSMVSSFHFDTIDLSWFDSSIAKVEIYRDLFIIIWKK